MPHITLRSHHSPVNRYCDQATGVQFLAEETDSSLLHRVQTGSKAHTASYPIGTADSILKCKVA